MKRHFLTTLDREASDEPVVQRCPVVQVGQRVQVVPMSPIRKKSKKVK